MTSVGLAAVTLAVAVVALAIAVVALAFMHRASEQREERAALTGATDEQITNHDDICGPKMRRINANIASVAEEEEDAAADLVR